jgi:hypothetical protein
MTYARFVAVTGQFAYAVIPVYQADSSRNLAAPLGLIIDRGASADTLSLAADAEAV